MVGAQRQHASEARLLLLLQSQRERLASAADELAALRALRAEQLGQPEVEVAALHRPLSCRFVTPGHPPHSA